MKAELPLILLTLPIVGGIVGTRIWAERRQRGAIALRLAKWTVPQIAQRPSLLKNRQRPSPATESLSSFNFHDSPIVAMFRGLVIEAGEEDKFQTFLILSLSLYLLPVLAAIALEFNLLVAMLIGLILAALPSLYLKLKAEARRTKFCEQLPDAIDLMVAVLRSGHSVSQAVKAVADEIPAPCGEECEAVLQRMNLGQPLSEALVYSSRRFRSYELDLIRRAVAIQVDVGGSLAELLDKTNFTLRQRLKLVRQLKVITSQSRLSAWIVGSLPVVLAIMLNCLSPGYLNMLIDDSLGRMLLGTVVVLEIIGIVVMKRMSTMRI